MKTRTKRPRRPSKPSRRYPAEVLTEHEVRQLLRACSVKAPTGVRNRALITMLYRAGLRIGEALALKPKDLDGEAGTVRVLHGKGDRSRTVGLDPSAFALVERWLDVRRHLGIGARKPVFCTLQGGPMKDAYMRALLPRLARKAGIDKRVHAHGLRHTHAFELACKGHPLHVIQAQLGHASVSTTDRYISHLAPQQVIETMRSRVWSPVYPLLESCRNGVSEERQTQILLEETLARRPSSLDQTEQERSFRQQIREHVQAMKRAGIEVVMPDQ